MSGASMNTIKNRIKSVEGTMQITKAMELVATSKLRRAKEMAESVKPYMKVLCETVSSLSSVSSGTDSPFSELRDGRTLYIVIAGDRGLAGGYNSNIFKLAASHDSSGEGIYLPIGKKTLDYFSRRGRTIFSSELAVAAQIGVGDSLKMAKSIADAFIAGEFTSVKLIYTKFVSMLTQLPVCEEILPLKQDAKGTPEPLYEGDIDEMLSMIIPQYIGGMLYSGVCEAVASECGARRCAMNSANKNAEEMIGDLRLKFNRARQAVITQEITEIVSGAEAL